MKTRRADPAQLAGVAKVLAAIRSPEAPRARALPIPEPSTIMPSATVSLEEIRAWARVHRPPFWGCARCGLKLRPDDTCATCGFCLADRRVALTLHLRHQPRCRCDFCAHFFTQPDFSTPAGIEAATRATVDHFFPLPKRLAP